MASTVPVLLLLSAVLFTATFADDDCKSYITSTGVAEASIKCGNDHKSVVIGVTGSGACVFIMMVHRLLRCPALPLQNVPKPRRGPGYPVSYSQAAYDGGQAAYPIQPPVQPGFAHPPPPTDYSSTQPAYNPAYMEQPKTGY
ncbi:hypothetical protein cypCar_00004826 [Cyprinus carpio]|nr:hypothetical protein cypCar_00004826 [Cyprinus carpio]